MKTNQSSGLRSPLNKDALYLDTSNPELLKITLVINSSMLNKNIMRKSNEKGL